MNKELQFMPPHKNDSEDVNGWGEWSRYVLKELERLNAQYDKLGDKMEGRSNELTEKLVKQSKELTEELNSKVNSLSNKIDAQGKKIDDKTKDLHDQIIGLNLIIAKNSGVWGFIAGAIPIVITIIIFLISKFF